MPELPRQVKSTTLYVRIPAPIKAKLQQLADEAGMTLAGATTVVLQDALAGLEEIRVQLRRNGDG